MIGTRRFYVLFGNYQTTSGNTEAVGDAFNKWLIFPGIEDGSVQSGGYSSPFIRSRIRYSGMDNSCKFRKLC